MKKTILILSMCASASLFAESPVIPEFPETNPCLYVADAGCHIGPDGSGFPDQKYYTRRPRLTPQQHKVN